MADRRNLVHIDSQKLLINYFIQNDGASRADVARALGMSKPAVSENIAEMIEHGMLAEYGQQGSGVGKKGTILKFQAQNYLILMLDMTNNVYDDAISLTVYSLSYRMLLSEQIPLNGEQDETVILDKVHKCLLQSGVSTEHIRVAVVAAPGVFKNNIEQAPQLEAYRYEKIKELLQEHYACGILILNDINLAAIGELNFGNGVGKTNMAYLWLDRGFGGALILNGQLYEGSFGSAGEVGYLRGSFPENETQLLRSQISIFYVEKRLRAEYQNSSYLTQQKSAGFEPSFSELIEGAKNEDSYCMQFVHTIIENIAQVVYNLAVMLDLELVVIDGHIRMLGQSVYSICQNRLSENPYSKTKVVFPLSQKPIAAGGYCAGKQWIIEHLFHAMP